MVTSDAAEYTIENFGLNPDETRAFTLSGIWNRDSPDILDFHGFHQVLMTVDGTILLYDANYQYPLYKHVAAFIPAELPHRVKAIRNNLNVSCESIFFNKKYFPFYNSEIAVFEITELGFALMNALNEKPLTNIIDSFRLQCMDLLVKVIKRDLLERKQELRLPVSNDARVLSATDYISKNYRSKLTLNDLAEAVNLSTRQLTRLFNSSLNMSPIEYLRTFRILQASVSMSASKENVINIALAHGYETISTFYRDFHKYFGTSPDKFRKIEKPIAFFKGERT